MDIKKFIITLKHIIGCDVYSQHIINKINMSHLTIQWFKSSGNQQTFAYKKRYLFCINRFTYSLSKRFPLPHYNTEFIYKQNTLYSGVLTNKRSVPVENNAKFKFFVGVDNIHKMTDSNMW